MSTSQPHVAAHLIVGGRPEPFLPALLTSLEGVADVLIVNENSGLSESENLSALRASSFAASNTLLLDQTPFCDFAAARNICLKVHREKVASAEWVAFVDADEVHTPVARRIAERLHLVPKNINFVDGYTYHFFQSFDWYMSIERRMAFHRFTPALEWAGAVHEQLQGMEATRIALPYVYMHYGHVFSAKRHVEKEELYAALGRPGHTAPPETKELIDRERYFAQFWPRLLTFRGAHPPAAATVLRQIREAAAADFAETDAIVARRSRKPGETAARFYWRMNYHLRWRSRAADKLARSLVSM